MGLIMYSGMLNTHTTSGEELVLPWANYTIYAGAMGLEDNVWDEATIGSYQFDPAAIRVKDKTFFVMDKNNSFNNSVFIVVYDHYRNKMTAPIDTGLTNDYGDIHNRPAISVQDDKIFIRVSARGGGTAVVAKSSLSAGNYDVRYFEDWTILDTNYYDRIEYPKMRVMDDGLIYSMERYAATWDASMIRYDGNNALYLRSVVETTRDLDIRPYVSDVKSYSDTDRKTVYRTFINVIENYRGKQQHLSYMESDDLITWWNASRTHSHNVDTNGKIYLDELTTDYLALKLPSENVGFIRCKGGIYTSDGNIYGLGGVDDDNNYGIIKYDASTKSWSSNKIVVSGFEFAKSYNDTGYNWSNMAVITKKDNYFRIYIQVLINSVAKAAEFKSLDAENWEFVQYLDDINNTDNNYQVNLNYSESTDLSSTLVMISRVNNSGIVTDVIVKPAN